MASVKLRPALPGDSDFILGVRNAAAVRAASLNSQPVVPEAHDAWFMIHRADLYVVEADGQRVGYVRVTLSEISIALTEAARGRGWGPQAIELAAHVARAHGFGRPRARIKPDNLVSQKAFAKAGFRQVYQVWEAQ